MSLEKRRTATVLGIIQEYFTQGNASIRPGDVNSILRERNMPMGAWEVRAEFSRLEAEGVIACDPETGAWHMAQSDASLKDTG